MKIGAASFSSAPSRQQQPIFLANNTNSFNQLSASPRFSPTTRSPVTSHQNIFIPLFINNINKNNAILNQFSTTSCAIMEKRGYDGAVGIRRDAKTAHHERKINNKSFSTNKRAAHDERFWRKNYVHRNPRGQAALRAGDLGRKAPGLRTPGQQNRRRRRRMPQTASRLQ